MRDDAFLPIYFSFFTLYRILYLKSLYNKPFGYVSRITKFYVALYKTDQEIRQMTSVWQLLDMILATQCLWMSSDFKTKS
jgi:hypothetical protein